MVGVGAEAPWRGHGMRRLAIPVEIVQRYFPESEIVYDYTNESYGLETRDGYRIPAVEMFEDTEENTDQLWCWFNEWPEIL